MNLLPELSPPSLWFPFLVSHFLSAIYYIFAPGFHSFSRCGENISQNDLWPKVVFFLPGDIAFISY